MHHTLPSHAATTAAGRNLLLWTLRIFAAAVLLPYAGFKLTAAPEFVAVFQMLGAEPVGRYLTAWLEITAAILLLLPRTYVQGALTGIIVMLGAVGSHLFVLGISVNEDHGAMFLLACCVLACLVFVVMLRDE